MDSYPEEFHAVAAQWREGKRARDWNGFQLLLGIQKTDGTWWEAWGRLMAFYHAFDSGGYPVAMRHIARAYYWTSGYKDPIPEFAKRVAFEYVYLCGLMNQQLEFAWGLFESTPLPDEEARLTYLRAKAAMFIAWSEPGAEEALDEADEIVRTLPSRDQDNIQAEADWLSDLRRRLGTSKG